MRLPEFLRKVPHSTAKPCGGAKADCSLVPESEASKYNWLQKAYWKHDVALKKAKRVADKAKQIRKQADTDLAKDLRSGNPKVLSLKEKVYRLKSMLVFR